MASTNDMEYQFLKKLQVNPWFSVSVINGPENVSALLGNIPITIQLNYQIQPNCDAYLVFAITKANLFEALDQINPFIKEKKKQIEINLSLSCRYKN